MTTFTDADRDRLVDIGDRLARIEQALEDRKSHGDRIGKLEHWRTWTFAMALGSVGNTLGHYLPAFAAIVGH